MKAKLEEKFRLQMLIMLKKQERSQIHNLTYNAWKHFDGVPEDEKGKGRKLISRNSGWDIPNPGRHSDIEVHEACWFPNIFLSTNCSLRNIIILSKVKDRNS